MHPALKLSLLGWRKQSHRTQPTDFVFRSRLFDGRKALDLAAVLKRKYLQAASNTKRNAQARLVEAILPVHMLPGKTEESVAPLLHPDSKRAEL
jgi:hypothetical protein